MSNSSNQKAAIGACTMTRKKRRCWKYQDQKSSRVINEFEFAIGVHTDYGVKEHPESSAYAQRNLIKHLNAMVKAVDDGLVSNPYLETDPNEFVSITTEEIYDPESTTV